MIENPRIHDISNLFANNGTEVSKEDILNSKSKSYQFNRMSDRYLCQFLQVMGSPFELESVVAGMAMFAEVSLE